MHLTARIEMYVLQTQGLALVKKQNIRRERSKRETLEARTTAPHQFALLKVDIFPFPIRDKILRFTDFSDVPCDGYPLQRGVLLLHEGVALENSSRPTNATPCAGSYSGVDAKLDVSKPISRLTNQCTALRRPPFNPHSLPRVLMSRFQRGEAEWTSGWGHLTRTTCYEAWYGSRLDGRRSSSIVFLLRRMITVSVILSLPPSLSTRHGVWLVGSLAENRANYMGPLSGRRWYTSTKSKCRSPHQTRASGF